MVYKSKTNIYLDQFEQENQRIKSAFDRLKEIRVLVKGILLGVILSALFTLLLVPLTYNMGKIKYGGYTLFVVINPLTYVAIIILITTTVILAYLKIKTFLELGYIREVKISLDMYSYKRQKTKVLKYLETEVRPRIEINNIFIKSKLNVISDDSIKVSIASDLFGNNETELLEILPSKNKENVTIKYFPSNDLSRQLFYSIQNSFKR